MKQAQARDHVADLDTPIPHYLTRNVEIRVFKNRRTIRSLRKLAGPDRNTVCSLCHYALLHKCRVPGRHGVLRVLTRIIHRFYAYTSGFTGANRKLPYDKSISDRRRCTAMVLTASESGWWARRGVGGVWVSRRYLSTGTRSIL